MGDESEEVNLITGTKKRNLGLKRLDEEDEGDDDEDDEKENDQTQKVKPKVQKPAQSAAQERVCFHLLLTIYGVFFDSVTSTVFYLSLPAK